MTNITPMTSAWGTESRRHAAVTLGAGVLAAHGVAALVAAGDLAAVPPEHNGLLFGLFGFPLLLLAAGLLGGAALLPTRHWRPVPVGGLVLVAAGDAYGHLGGDGSAPLLAGALAAAVALGLLASVTAWEVGLPGGDQRAAVLAAGFGVVAVLGVVVVLLTGAVRPWS